MKINGNEHHLAGDMAGKKPASIIQVTTTFTAYIAVMPGEDADEIAESGVVSRQHGLHREYSAEWNRVRPSEVPPGTAIWGPDHDFTREDFET